MIGVVKNYVFGEENFTPNTIIKGVGSVITTKSQLATKLGISVNTIRGFKILGNDIHCKMSNNYTIWSDSFNADLDVTDFIDFDGRVVEIGVRSFLGASNLKNLYAPNAYFNNQALQGCVSLDNYDFNEEIIYTKSTIGASACRNIKVKYVSLLNTNSLSNGLFQVAVIDTLDWSGTIISHDVFRNSILNNNPDFSNVTFVGTTAFYNCSGPPTLSFDSLIILDNSGQSFRQLTRTKNLLFPNLETITENAKNLTFRDMTALEVLSMKKCKTFGLPTSNNGTFTGIKTNARIEANIALATSNSGEADAALVWAKANRSAIVEFYDDNGNYVSTL